MVFDSIESKDPASALQAWYDTELGQSILVTERRMIERALLNVQGNRLLQVTLDGRQWFCDSARARHGVMVAPKLELGMEENSLIATPEELPVQSAVIDILVLHHALEFSEDPHQVLREAARVLRPGGHLILLGFNPVSLFGLHSKFKRAVAAPWSGRLLGASRLTDWFKLLQLTSMNIHSDSYIYPIENSRWRGRFNFLKTLIKPIPLSTGNLILMTARKDVAGMTPLRPVWNRRLLEPLRVIESKATSTGVRRNRS